MLQRAVWMQGTGKLMLQPLESRQFSTDGSGQSTQKCKKKSQKSTSFCCKRALFVYWPQSSFLICPSSSCRATFPVWKQWTMLTTTPSTSTWDLRHENSTERQAKSSGKQFYSNSKQVKQTQGWRRWSSLTWQQACHWCPEQGGASAGWRRSAVDRNRWPQIDHPSATAAVAGPGGTAEGRPGCRDEEQVKRSFNYKSTNTKTEQECVSITRFLLPEGFLEDERMRHSPEHVCRFLSLLIRICIDAR